MARCECGADFAPGMKFCPNCGKKKDEDSQRLEGGTIQDSVLVRSNVGQASVGNINIDMGAKSERMMICTACSNPISEKNEVLVCEEDDAKFCQRCELQFRRGIPRQQGEPVLCKKCYKESLKRKEEEQRKRKETEEAQRNVEEEARRKREVEERERQQIQEAQQQKSEKGSSPEPKDAGGWYTKGCIHYDAKEYDEAIKCFKEARIMMWHDTFSLHYQIPIYYMLACAYAQIKDYDNALPELTSWIQSTNNPKEIPHMMQQISDNKALTSFCKTKQFQDLINRAKAWEAGFTRRQ